MHGAAVYRHHCGMNTERITLTPTLHLEVRGGTSLVAVWKKTAIPINLESLTRWVLRQLRESIK